MLTLLVVLYGNKLAVTFFFFFFFFEIDEIKKLLFNQITKANKILICVVIFSNIHSVLNECIGIYKLQNFTFSRLKKIFNTRGLNEFRA